MPWVMSWCRLCPSQSRLCSSAGCLSSGLFVDSYETVGNKLWSSRVGLKAWEWRHSPPCYSRKRNTIRDAPRKGICSLSIISEPGANFDAGANAREVAGIDFSRKPGICLEKSRNSSGSGTLAGAVVALGKFDALHVGHRALAEHAAGMGTPFLVSFKGMAEVLGWEQKLPIVAKCDRKRVMGIWAISCGGMVPQEYSLEFGKVRSLSPKQFVEKLALELHVKGVVAGANYRFGYKAAGDASDLVRLCVDYGLEVFIVDPVMDVSGEYSLPVEGAITDNKRERGQVSSTRVRKALAAGQIKRVAGLLGRNHRLLITSQNMKRKQQSISIPLLNVLNQPPKEGTYVCIVTVEGQNLKLPGRADIIELGNEEIVITATDIEIPSESGKLNLFMPSTLLGLEFLSENLYLSDSQFDAA